MASKSNSHGTSGQKMNFEFNPFADSLKHNDKFFWLDGRCSKYKEVEVNKNPDNRLDYFLRACQVLADKYCGKDHGQPGIVTCFPFLWMNRHENEVRRFLNGSNGNFQYQEAGVSYKLAITISMEGILLISDKCKALVYEDIRRVEKVRKEREEEEKRKEWIRKYNEETKNGTLVRPLALALPPKRQRYERKEVGASGMYHNGWGGSTNEQYYYR
jgi:hypothetical protein